jgi:ketopantoate reductase
MKIKAILLLLFSLLLQAQQQTKPALNKNGIVIYTSKKGNSSIKQYEAQMTVNAIINEVEATIMDIDQLKNWNYKTSVSKVLKKVNDSTLIVYMVNHLGWPLQDRDNVARVVVSHNNEEVIITISPENNFMKPQKGIIRVTNFKGFWSLKKITTTSTQITQSFYADIGGNIPTFLVNSMITQAPYETFKALKDRLK